MEDTTDKILRIILYWILAPMAIIISLAFIGTIGYIIYDALTKPKQMPDELIKHCIKYHEKKRIQPVLIGKWMGAVVVNDRKCVEHESRVRINGVLYRITGMEEINGE